MQNQTKQSITCATEDLASLQHHHGRWAEGVVWGRRARRLPRTVDEALAVEQGFLRRSRPPLRRLTRNRGPGPGRFVRVGSVDLPVLPEFTGRRLGVRVSPDGTPLDGRDPHHRGC